MDGSASDSTDATDLDAAADRLYAAPAEQFMSVRTDLAAQAKTHHRTALAKRITELRKPTLAASLVNRLVLADPPVLDRLADLYDRLRQAHEDLAADRLRELSTERRVVVGELVASALALDGRTEPPAAVHDDVLATLDAAVADPEIAARLGRLTKPERWSGFGISLPTGTPELTLVRGGQDRAAGERPARREAPPRRQSDPTGAGRDSSVAQPSAPAPSASARRAIRTRDKAQAAFDAADANLSTAIDVEKDEAEHVKSLATQLTDLQHQLEQAKRRLDKARREVKSARVMRRETRSALDRAERRSMT